MNEENPIFIAMLLRNDRVKYAEQKAALDAIFDEKPFDEKSLSRHKRISKLLERWLGRESTYDIYLYSYL